MEANQFHSAMALIESSRKFSTKPLWSYESHQWPGARVNAFQDQPTPPKPRKHIPTPLWLMLAVKPGTNQPWKSSLLKKAHQGARSGAHLSRRRYFIPKCIWEHVRKEEIEIEKEKSTYHPNFLKKSQKAHKSLWKEVMEIETKNAQLKKTPPKKVVNKRTKHKETPKELAPRKKRPKRNTPGKALALN